MAVSMYRASVPVFTQFLSSLSDVLGRTNAYAVERKIEPAAILGTRLYPDMFPLSRQVQIATDHAKGAGARLAGVAIPSYPDTETTFDELAARIATTIQFVGGLDEGAFEGAEGRDLTLTVAGRDLTVKGDAYLFGRALPNFFFHVTTAYNIARHLGVEIGKRDFMGRG